MQITDFTPLIQTGLKLQVRRLLKIERLGITQLLLESINFLRCLIDGAIQEMED